MGTLLTTHVAQPNKYGQIVVDNQGLIANIVEKPLVTVSNLINAGIYLFDLRALDLIILNNNHLVEDLCYPLQKIGELFAYSLRSDSYWMDIGNPSDYLKAQELYLSHQDQTILRIDKSFMISSEESDVAISQGYNLLQSDQYTDQSEPLLNPENPPLCIESKLTPLIDPQNAKRHPSLIIEPVIIDNTALVHPTSIIGPNVVIGARCYIGAGCKIQNATIMSDTVLNGYDVVKNSIVGWKNNIGKWCQIINNSNTGVDVEIKDETILDKVQVVPHIYVDQAKVDLSKNITVILI
ncbi:mannose-1-phosphate guanylyltransferase [Stylonychia lemnae]|uniref:Mannose-1-phosphate guanylyltransferase n=1 Tax=Stylonychia lemnae TaxID=5949 RepID=A0A078AKQ9_STYLE|nr:mannose-1-phosphate guanylyltransferase [Stylonychia lemnae]|eukprot:CDW82037.1 mannose-1-phosphate guanylyltransferase [Stylonychia lemnae]